MTATDFMPFVRWAILRDEVPRSWLDNLHDALHTSEMQKSFMETKKLTPVSLTASRLSSTIRSVH